MDRSSIEEATGKTFDKKRIGPVGAPGRPRLNPQIRL
jgi:hypothetical protein